MDDLFMYVFHTNPIWDSIKDQSNCGLYLRIVFMNICFGLEVRPFLLCYKFDLIGPCWSKISISSSRFVCSFGQEHCVWVLKPKSVWKFHRSEDDSIGYNWFS